MNDEQLARLMASPRLPTLPKVALRILDLVQSPDVSISELSATIAADPALASKILKTANSGLYGRVRGVGKLHEAVMVLGLRNVKTLALGFSLVSEMSGNAGSRLDYAMFWRRSVIAACGARAASARVDRGRHGDEAFLGGLMHALGIVAFDCALGREYAEIATSLGEGFEVVLSRELDELGVGHVEVGGMLARAWNLPPSLVAAIEHYPAPALAATELRTTVACVALGAHCGDVATATNSGRALFAFRSAAADVGVSQADAHDILEEALNQAAVLLKVFEGPESETIVPADILSRAHDALLELTVALVAETGRLENERTELMNEAYVDALTLVANRRHLDEFLAREVAVSLRSGKQLSLLIIDVDHFKSVNDTHGHPAGDAVLRKLAAVIRTSVRAADFVARFGGEEFAVVLPETGSAGARESAERIRAVVSAARFEAAPGRPVPVTVSVGVATVMEAGAGSVSAVIAAADAALYAAKHGGRNRVIAAA